MNQSPVSLVSSPWSFRRKEPSTSQTTQRRWNYFKDRLIEEFGTLVYKVGVDAGFDCPNRDGTKGFGGCAYCSQVGSLSPHQDPTQSLKQQLQSGMAFTRRRYKAQKFIAYFQAFTNTYAPVSVLRERFEAALGDPDILGLSVATRPDCVNPQNVEYLAELSSHLAYFTVELGLQSAYQNRLAWVNRQESVEDYIRAMELLNAAKIKVVTHVILGFPGESYKDMADTAKLAADCKSAGIKLQMLHVIKGTKLAHIYSKEPFELMSREVYADLVVRLIERLPAEVQIHRITGETARDQLVAPEWTSDKTAFFRLFEKLLEERDTYQGKFQGDWRSVDSRK